MSLPGGLTVEQARSRVARLRADYQRTAQNLERLIFEQVKIEQEEARLRSDLDHMKSEISLIEGFLSRSPGPGSIVFPYGYPPGQRGVRRYPR